jgi:hypothetical protein
MAGVGNLRPKVKGHRTKEVKAGIPRHQPLVDELTPTKAERDDEVALMLGIQFNFTLVSYIR